MLDTRLFAFDKTELVIAMDHFGNGRQDFAGVAHPFADALDHRQILNQWNPNLLPVLVFELCVEDYERGLLPIGIEPVVGAFDAGIEKRPPISFPKLGIDVDCRYDRALEPFDWDMARQFSGEIRGIDIERLGEIHRHKVAL